MGNDKDDNSNFKILQEDKKTTRAFAEEKAKESTPPELIATKLSENTKKLTHIRAKVIYADKATNSFIKKTLLDNSDLTKAIALLFEINDNKLNIVWHKQPGKPPTLVRDARNVTTDVERLKKDSGEIFAIQILNEVRGALLLLAQKYPQKNEGAPLDEARILAEERLLKLAEHALDNVDMLNKKNVRKYNSTILFFLEEAKIGDANLNSDDEKTEDINNKLKFAKEMANFQDEHKNIVTLTTNTDEKNQSHTVCEAEIMLNGLTNEQRAEYQEIADGKSGPAWYVHQPKYKRDIIRQYADVIQKGQKVIPTQLLSELAGLRNAYEKITSIMGPDKKKLIELDHTLHSGAPVSKFKTENENVDKDKIRQDVTNNNIEQYKSYLEDNNDELVLNNLTSKTPLDARGEKFIFKLLKSTSSKDVNNSSTPINRWRMLGGGQNLKMADRVLEQVSTDLKEYITVHNDNERGLVDVLFLLKTEPFKMMELPEKQLEEIYKFANDKITSLINSESNSDNKLGEYLQLALEVKDLKNSFNLASKENVNLNISAKLHLIQGARKNLFKEKIITNKALTSYVFAFFCKSGKDRTGYVLTKISNMAVSVALKINPKSQKAKDNLFAQVAGGHTQFMAATQGGSIGAAGVKTNPEFQLSTADNHIKGILDRDSAHNNNIKIDENHLKKLRKRKKLQINPGGNVSKISAKQKSNKEPIKAIPASDRYRAEGENLNIDLNKIVVTKTSFFENLRKSFATSKNKDQAATFVTSSSAIKPPKQTR